MGDDTLISIVTATFNRSNVLKYSIESVLNQTFENWELLIIGDCCSDDTDEVVNSFGDPRIRFINLEKNIGEQSGPNNYGIQLSKGNYISFLNHDDLWFPDHLALLYNELTTSQADLVYSWFYAVPSEEVSFIISCISENNQHDLTFFTPASSWLFKKEVVSDVGPWKFFKDIYEVPSQDWITRVYNAGKKIRVINKITVVGIQSGARKNAYLNRDFKENAHYLDQINNNPNLREEILTKSIVLFASRDQQGFRHHFARAIINPLKKLIVSIGMRPVALKNRVLFRKKGGFINYLRQKRGLTKI